MKKTLLSLAVLSSIVATGAHADSQLGAKGTIFFNGSITTDSCTVRSPGASSSGANLTVDMGPVSASTLGTESQPTTGGGGLATISKNIDLEVECVSGATVALKLTPNAISGKGIAVQGGAQNVQIMLVNDNTALDFSSGSVELQQAYAGGGVVSIPLQAYYTRKTGADAADVVAGVANAAVVYELRYE